MHRHELEERIREALGGTATRHAAELALDAVIRAVREGLREDGEVKLARFGTFRLTECAPRRLLLPRTGEERLLPARRELRFTPAANREETKHRGE